jgi:hypothetical protein
MPEVTIHENHGLLLFRCPDQTTRTAELVFASIVGGHFYTLHTIGSITGTRAGLIDRRLRTLLATAFPDRHELSASGAALLKSDRRVNDELRRLSTHLQMFGARVSAGLRRAFVRGEGKARWNAEVVATWWQHVSDQTRAIAAALGADFGARALLVLVLSFLWLGLTGTFGYGWLRERPLPRGALFPATNPAVLESWSVPAALTTVALAFVCLSLLTPRAPTNGSDGAAIGHLVRNCLELGRCATAGPRSSDGLLHGTIWVSLLMLVRLLGGQSGSDQLLVHVFLSVGLGTLLLVLWRWLRPEVAIGTTLVSLYAVLADPNTHRCYAPSAAFGLNALCFCATLFLASTGRARFAAVAAVLLSLAINLHLGSLVWVPGLVAAALLAGRRPFATLMLCVVLLAGVGALFSLGTTLVNASTLLVPRTCVLLVGSGAALLLACAWTRPWFLRSSLEIRAMVLCGIVGLTFSIARVLVPSLMDWSAGADHCRYVTIVPASVLTALVGARLTDRLAARLSNGFRFTHRRLALGGLLTSCLALLLAQEGWHRMGWFWASKLPVADRAQRWTGEDARLVETVLSHRGLTFKEEPYHLETAGCWDLVPTLGVYADPPARSAEVDPFRQVRLWLVRDDQLPTRRQQRGMDVIRLPNHRAVLVSEIDSWLDMDRMEHCLGGEEHTGDETCWPADFLPREKPASGFLFTDRDLFWDDHRTERLFQRENILIPLRTTDETRSMTLYQDEAPNACTWKVASVEGLPYEQSLQAHAVRIQGRAGAKGRLVLETVNTPGCQPPELPPCLIETTPRDPVALASGASFSGAGF